MRWPWTPPPATPARLTEAQACALAGPALIGRDAVAGREAELTRTDRGLEWRVATVAIGSGAVVRIDDRDGSVIGTGRWGLR